MDCRHVTLGREPCAILAVDLGDVVVAIVQSCREMGGGAAGFPASNWPIVNEDNGTAGAREEVGGCHTGDSSADHADIRPEILSQRLKLRNFGGSHPDV